MVSSTPVTATVCATFQLALVKTSELTPSDSSVGSSTESAMVTSAVGAVASTTLKPALDWPSLVCPRGCTAMAGAVSVAVTFAANSEVLP